MKRRKRSDLSVGGMSHPGETRTNNEDNFAGLRDGGFLTRDSRMKERKKCGLHGARRGTQFSKR